MINNIYVHNSPIICINGHYISHYYQDIECGCGRVYVLERERERGGFPKKKWWLVNFFPLMSNRVVISRAF